MLIARGFFEDENREKEDKPLDNDLLYAIKELQKNLDVNEIHQFFSFNITVQKDNRSSAYKIDILSYCCTKQYVQNKTLLQLVELFKKLEPQTQEYMLLNDDYCRAFESTLHYVIKYKPIIVAPILAGLDKIKILAKKNHSGWCAFMELAKAPASCIEATLKGIELQKLYLLNLQDDEGYTAPMIAAQHNPDALIPLLEGISSQKKCEILNLKIDKRAGASNLTAVMLAARYNPAGLDLMFDGLNSQQKLSLIREQSFMNWNAVMYGARYNPSSLEPLLKDIAPENKKSLFRKQGHLNLGNYSSPFIVAVQYHPIGLAYMLPGLNATDICELPLLEDAHNKNAMDYAAQYHNEKALAIILEYTQTLDHPSLKKLLKIDENGNSIILQEAYKNYKENRAFARLINCFVKYINENNYAIYEKILAQYMDGTTVEYIFSLKERKLAVSVLQNNKKIQNTHFNTLLHMVDRGNIHRPTFTDKEQFLFFQITDQNSKNVFMYAFEQYAKKTNNDDLNYILANLVVQQRWTGDKKLNIEQKFTILMQQDSQGQSLCMYAARYYPEGLVPMLEGFRIKKGENFASENKAQLLMAQDNEGISVFMIAAEKCPSQLPLLSEGFIPEIRHGLYSLKNKAGCTALMIAAKHKTYGVQCLLDGLCLEIQMNLLTSIDNEQKNAIDYAVEYGSEESLITILDIIKNQVDVRILLRIDADSGKSKVLDTAKSTFTQHDFSALIIYFIDKASDENRELYSSIFAEYMDLAIIDAILALPFEEKEKHLRQIDQDTKTQAKLKQLNNNRGYYNYYCVTSSIDILSEQVQKIKLRDDEALNKQKISNG